MPFPPRGPASVCLALILASAAAPIRSASQPEARVADLVSIDFLVADERGMPIPDLRKDEISFKLDGKLR